MRFFVSVGERGGKREKGRGIRDERLSSLSLLYQVE
jgi:hypothetical protein